LRTKIYLSIANYSLLRIDEQTGAIGDVGFLRSIA
jgi:hypothetical protein